MAFQFQCPVCKQGHEGMPAFLAEAPLSYYDVPEKDRAARCRLTAQDCVIDDRWFFVRGNIEIPVHGVEERFIWGVWASISRDDFSVYQSLKAQPTRKDAKPFPGWLDMSMNGYPDTRNLQLLVHLRDGAAAPLIELRPDLHPLAFEQRQGIEADRVAYLYAMMTHPNERVGA